MSSSHRLSEAFTRRARVQMMPDLKGLDVPKVRAEGRIEFRRKEPEEAETTTSIEANKSPWIEYRRLGELAQGGAMELGCKLGRVVMFKKTPEVEGRKESSVLAAIKHQNVIGIQATYAYDRFLYLGLDHCRYTVEEIVSVPLDMDNRPI